MRSPENLPWLIYGLGGGLGHLNRTIALARRAVTDRPVTILSNSPYAPMVADRLRDSAIKLIALAPDLDTVQGPRRIGEYVRAWPGAILVDNLPRGIWGELVQLLPPFGGPRILILRDLPPGYVAQVNLGEFIPQHYEGVVVPGAEEWPDALPMLGDRCGVALTSPWLSCTPGDLPSRAIAQTYLHIDRPAAPTILIFASGLLEEHRVYATLARELHQALPWVNIRYLSLTYHEACPMEIWVRHFPGMACLPAADVVIGGGGYNLFYECMALQLPLICFTWDRKYDRQHDRALRGQVSGLVQIVQRGEPVLPLVSTLLQNQIAAGQWVSQRGAISPWINGVEQGYRAIRGWIETSFPQCQQRRFDQLIQPLP